MTIQRIDPAHLPGRIAGFVVDALDTGAFSFRSDLCRVSVSVSAQREGWITMQTIQQPNCVLDTHAVEVVWTRSDKDNAAVWLALVRAYARKTMRTYGMVRTRVTIYTEQHRPSPAEIESALKGLSFKVERVEVGED